MIIIGYIFIVRAVVLVYHPMAQRSVWADESKTYITLLSIKKNCLIQGKIIKYFFQMRKDYYQIWLLLMVLDKFCKMYEIFK